MSTQKEEKVNFPFYVWFHSTWGAPIPDGGKIVKVFKYYRKSPKHSLQYEDEKGNTMNVEDCIIHPSTILFKK